MKFKKVLIANQHLEKYQGSQIHCLELAEYFINLGFRVDVAAFKVGKPITKKFQHIGIDVVNLSNLEKKYNDYFLVWSHHRPVFYFLHAHLKIRSRYFIHQLLSPFVEIEFFPLFQDSKIDRRLTFFANSQETRALALRQSGAASINILHNSVPDEFFSDREIKTSKKGIKKIAVVSNHPPIEVRAAMRKFMDKGISVIIYGKKDKVENITPQLLAKFDLVVTIGKTVQYCFASMIPVYNYDYHGGGYISLSNLDELEYYNFSGRYPGGLKSPNAIYEEIKTGYISALEELPQLKKEASSRYKLNLQLDSFIQKLNHNEEMKPLELNKSDAIIADYVECYVPKIKQNFLKQFTSYIKSWKKYTPLR